MNENQMNTSSNKMVAVILDVLGLILVLVGGLINYAHSRSGVGVGLFWIGFVLLIVALILFLWDAMKKPMMQKM